MIIPSPNLFLSWVLAPHLYLRSHWFQYALAAYQAYTSYKNGKDARAGADAAGQDQINFAHEQWDYFKDKFGPLQDKIIEDTTKGVQYDYAGVTGRASSAVVQAFDKAREATDRKLLRYNSPNSGAFVNAQKNLGVDQAVAEAGAINTARETERRNVDDLNFNRKLAVVGLGKNIPGQVQNGLNSGARILADSANAHTKDAASAALYASRGFNGGYGVNGNNDFSASASDTNSYDINSKAADYYTQWDSNGNFGAGNSYADNEDY